MITSTARYKKLNRFPTYNKVFYNGDQGVETLKSWAVGHPPLGGETRLRSETEILVSRRPIVFDHDTERWATRSSQA